MATGFLFLLLACYLAIRMVLLTFLLASWCISSSFCSYQTFPRQRMLYFSYSRYIWAGMVVLLGIGINIYQKNKKKINWILLNIFSIALIKMREVFIPSKKEAFEV